MLNLAAKKKKHEFAKELTEKKTSV